jgi:glycosyltransferase involved in cell wall biosynthesis
MGKGTGMGEGNPENRPRPPRVAAVIQRYGREVVGGESLCRSVMSRLRERFDVTVLTTCALDYQTWANVFPEGREEEDGVPVLRFPVVSPRNPRFFSLVSRFVLSRRRRGREWLSRSRLARMLDSYWFKLQGPYCPGLPRYLAAHRDDFDVFLFYCYLYYPTAAGLPIVASKSILIPFAHDEATIYLNGFRELFRMPRALVFLSPEERSLMNGLFDISHLPQEVAALGVPTLDDLVGPDSISPEDVGAFRRRFGLDRPYFLFNGRIERSKGSDWLFSRFLSFVNTSSRDCLLVLAGRAYVGIPRSDRIRFLGYLSEREKSCAILGCEALVLPSPYESLSVALLEAFGLRRPAIVNAESAVLLGHIERSGAGFAVRDAAGFREAALRVLEGAGRELGERGYRYIKANYSWAGVEDSYSRLIDLVCGRSG